jgi:uncharacterized Zn finger protein
MRCTCPDPAVPCKHIAATFYLLAERFDDDPFAILLWRGRPREELLADLGAGARARGDDRGTGPVAALADLTLPDAAAALDRSWLAPVPLPPRPPTLDAGPDLLLRQLAAPPAGLGGRGLTQALHELYLRLPGDDPPA